MINYDKKVFAENLRFFLSMSGMTSSELANRLNVSRSIVSEWCNAKKIPRMDKIEAMAKIFHISISDLLEKDEYDYSLDSEERISSIPTHMKEKLERKYPNNPRAQWIEYFDWDFNEIVKEMNRKERLSRDFPGSFSDPPREYLNMLQEMFEDENAKFEKVSEDEKLLIDLFRSVPDDKKKLAIEMIRAALKAQ